MLLFCVQVGQGHWLHMLLASGMKEQATSSESGHADETRTEGREEDQKEQEGSGRHWGGRVLRSRRSAEGPCGLHSILLQ
ncbi:persephin-like, partial [Clarias magur]